MRGYFKSLYLQLLLSEHNWFYIVFTFGCLQSDEVDTCRLFTSIELILIFFVGGYCAIENFLNFLPDIIVYCQSQNYIFRA